MWSRVLKHSVEFPYKLGCRAKWSVWWKFRWTPLKFLWKSKNFFQVPFCTALKFSRDPTGTLCSLFYFNAMSKLLWFVDLFGILNEIHNLGQNMTPYSSIAIKTRCQTLDVFQTLCENIWNCLQRKSAIYGRSVYTRV